MRAAPAGLTRPQSLGLIAATARTLPAEPPKLLQRSENLLVILRPIYVFFQVLLPDADEVVELRIGQGTQIGSVV